MVRPNEGLNRTNIDAIDNVVGGLYNIREFIEEDVSEEDVINAEDRAQITLEMLYNNCHLIVEELSSSKFNSMHFRKRTP